MKTFEETPFYICHAKKEWLFRLLHVANLGSSITFKVSRLLQRQSIQLLKRYIQTTTFKMVWPTEHETSELVSVSWYYKVLKELRLLFDFLSFTICSPSWRSAMSLLAKRRRDRATPTSSTCPPSTCTPPPTRWGSPALSAPLDQSADHLRFFWSSLRMAWMLLEWTFLTGRWPKKI